MGRTHTEVGIWRRLIRLAAGLARLRTCYALRLAFDRPKQCKILKEASIRTMLARPSGEPGQDKNGKPVEVYYGCGWNIHPFTGGRISTWHTGSLPGTSAEVAQLGNGVAFVVLFNARDTRDKKNAAGLIEGKLNETADAVKRWPR